MENNETEDHGTFMLDPELIYNGEYIHNNTCQLFYSLTILTNAQIGIIHFIISIFLIILQILTLWSFHKISKPKSNSTFKVMKHQGYSAIISLICHLITSIFTIFNIKHNIYFESFIGGLLQGSYFGCVTLILLVTLNRFDVMYKFNFLSSYTREKIFSCGIIICYLIALPFAIFYIIPRYRLIYCFTIYEWYCQSSNYTSFVVCDIQNKMVLLILVISFILHILIFLKIICLRCSTSKKNILSLQDMKFIIYALLCFATVAILELMWNEVLSFVYSTELGSIFPPTLYIVVSGSNAIFTICFVKEIRKNVLWCFNRMKINTVSVLS